MAHARDHDFQDRQEWRSWLIANHASEPEVWLIIQKKTSEKDGVKYPEAVEEALCFGWIDSKMQRLDAERFRLRFSPRRHNSIWSKRNRDTAEQLIQAGKMTAAGFAAITAAKRSGQWDAAYSSKTAPNIPADLRSALHDHAAAWDNFSRFSNSAQFQYIYWVQSAKREATRRRRIRTVVKRAAHNIKPG